jgi:choline kinase
MTKQTRAVQALILAAGNGTRLGLGGKAYAKPLAPLEGKPLLHRVLELAESAGIERFVVITGGFDQALRAAFEQDELAPRITFQFNPLHRLSNGVSALAAEPHCDPRFALLMADHLFSPQVLLSMLDEPLEEGECLLAVDRKIGSCPDLPDATKVRTREGRIVSLGKGLQDFDALDTGLFVCSRGLFEALRAARRGGDCSLSDGMNQLARQGRLRAFEIGPAPWLDIDTPASLGLASGLWRQIENRLFSPVVPNG